MMITDFKILRCPECRASLRKTGRRLACLKCKKKFSLKDGIPDFLGSEDLPFDLQLTAKKWGDFYTHFYKNLTPARLKKELEEAQKTISQMERFYQPKRGDFFLELGCGPAFFCQYYARQGLKTVGIELSFLALKGARKLFEKRGLKDCLVVCGDIQKMPFRDNTFDMIYGGGVIEHVKDTSIVVREMYRILKPNGVSFNMVPYLNLGALFYRQALGNIPNFPVLKNLAEFVHLKILKSKNMVFGYEYSFTEGYLRKIYQNAGFRKIKIDKFEVDLEFVLFKNKILKRTANYLAQNFRLFWPMIYVKAEK